MEMKKESDDNNVTEHLHDVSPTVGMLSFQCIFVSRFCRDVKIFTIYSKVMR